MKFEFSRKRRKHFLVASLLCLGVVVSAQAQVENESLPETNADLDQIEAEIVKTPEQNEKKAQNLDKENKDTSAVEPQTLSDLSRLAPFSDVTVLQKRYQPKSKRFQIHLGLGGITNDPWFMGLGGSLRFGYHFTEAWGVEATFTGLSTSERESAKELYANNAVSTSSIVSTKGYTGVDVYWSPIYGKMSLVNKRIIPFDMYFTGGLGSSAVDGAKTSSVSAFHVGTGQIFAINKSWAFRWDFSWNTFSATQTSSTGSDTATQFNNLILTMGGSFFFPEANYR